MAKIRVTGITLQLDGEFLPEGVHLISDEALARVKGLPGVEEVLEDSPTIQPPQPPSQDPEPDFPNHEGA